MATKNDVTGDTIQTRALSKQGRDNWDNIFGNANDMANNIFRKKKEQDDRVDSKQIGNDAVTEN